jgi:hypothetical protein
MFLLQPGVYLVGSRFPGLMNAVPAQALAALSGRMFAA